MAELAWFPFYVDRFLSSRKTRTMTPEQVGIYLLLLCEQWDHGAVPDDPVEIEDIARVPYDRARVVLERCFSLTEHFHGWTNDALEEIRAEQLVRAERLSNAGRLGAAKRYGTKRKKPGHSHPIATPSDSQAMAPLSQAMRPHSNRREEKIEETEELPPPGGGEPEPGAALAPVGWRSTDAGSWTGANVVGAYVDYCRSKGWPDPPPSTMAKQGAVGKRLAEKNPPATIVQAMIGMGTLFPHCPPKSEPWDLFDLERKFTKACAAVMNDPKLQEAAFDEAFMRRVS